MPIIYNGYGDCASDLIGSGIGFCDPETLGDFVGINLYAKGSGRYSITGTLKTLITNDIKALRRLPYRELYSFENNNAENETNTSNLQVMSVVRAGKPSFTFTFTKGTQFHKSLYSKMANSKWDYTFEFTNGELMALSNDGLTLEPFKGGMLSVQSINFASGTDLQTSTATLQLLDATQFNTRNVFLSYADNNINNADLAGVVETNMTFATPPSAGDPLIVRVAYAGNMTNPVQGLDDEANFRITGTLPDGAEVTAVAYNETNGTYSLTVSPALVAGNQVQVILTDGTNDVAVDADNILFKGRTPLTTVVA